MAWKSSVVAVALAVATPSLAASQPCEAGDAGCAAAMAESRDTARLAAQKLIEQADGARGERARLGYREAASAFLLLWQTYFADPCRGKEPSCVRGEEVLYNASRAFRAAHDLERASEVNGTLFDPQFNLQNTELAKKTLRDEGFVQQALTEYAKAASLYERFAKAAPKDEHAPEALLDAVVLRLGLHERAAAEKNAEQWVKLYAQKSVDSRAKLVVVIAESKRDAGASPRELRHYLSQNRAAVATAQSEHLPAVDVMLGRAVAADGDLAGARPHFERAAAFEVLPLIKRLSSEEQSIANRRLGKALIGIADAHLWLADQARDAAMKLSLVKSDPESLKKKREAVTVAEKQYAKVLGLQPLPPPIAVVEAGARVARMRGQLWAQAHLAFGPETADLMLAEAKAAYRNCVDLGVKYQAHTPAAAACAKWLERHYPAEYPAITEPMPQPKWSKTRFAKPRPLDDGEEVVPSP